jgi:DNA-binding winged helix-turn-helix (wHTH) protein
VSATHKLLRFGAFELNLDTEELRKSGTLIKLSPQPFRLLGLLAKHSGQIVTREEIKEQLWGDETFVDFEQGMNHCIKQIRTVLGDNAGNPLYVETVPRRGYRFLAPVVSKNVLAPAPQIIKSQSGIQSGVLPALKSDGTGAASKEQEPDLKVNDVVADEQPAQAPMDAGNRDPLSDSGVVPIHLTTAVALEEIPALDEKVTSAVAATEILAPKIARLRKSSAGTRRTLLWIAALVVVFVITGILYWYSHRP